MNTTEEFDPTRSAAIRSMLVRTVDESRPSRVRGRRFALLAALVAAAMLLAGGSVAAALNARTIFSPQPPAPVAPVHSDTPTPTPPRTPTSTSPAAAPTPTSTIPFDCAQLGGTVGQSLNLTMKSLSPELFSVEQASLEQAGVLSCLWADSDAGTLIQLDAVADRSTGLADVRADLGNGWATLGIGDAGALDCSQSITPGCRASVVDGAYWFVIDVQDATVTGNDRAGAIRTAGKALIQALRTHPEPVPAWRPPTTAWDGVTCGNLSGVPVGEIVGASGLTGPAATLAGSKNGIEVDLPTSIDCYWSTPTQPPAGSISSVTVEIGPGSGWAWSERSPMSDVTPVSVAGADQAQWSCENAEGIRLCQLDVLAGDSWLRFWTQAGMVPGEQQKMIAVAEAILRVR